MWVFGYGSLMWDGWERERDCVQRTIGVVGPTRMDYLSAMASVRAVAARLSEAASDADAAG